MITIYKKNTIPETEEVVRFNDIYFNKNTADLLDDRAKNIIKQIDHSEMLEKYAIGSRFDGTRLNIDKLSTGCKTALNVMYNPDRIFDICECGENALEVIYSLDAGKIYCEYPMIAFNLEKAKGIDDGGVHEFDDYEDLREWWKNED